MEKSEKVNLIALIVLIGFFLAVVFHYIIGFYLGGIYPTNTFLGNPEDSFTDFTKIVSTMANSAPFVQVNPWFNYFPLAYVLYYPFALIGNNLVSFGIYAFVFVSFLFYANTKFFTCKIMSFWQNVVNVLVITTLSYPVLLVLDRGNLDAILLIIFTLFVFLFKSEKYLLSALCLSFLNAIKPFHLLFLFLFLFKKKYKEFFFSIVLSFVMIITGFLLLKGDFFTQVSNLILNLSYTKAQYLIENNNYGMVQNSSLFMALKLIFCRLSSPPVLSTVVLIKIYNVLSLISTIAILFFVAKEKTFWKQVAILMFSVLAFSYLTNDYKLIFVLVPMWLFVNAKECSRFDLAYAVLYGLLLIPKNLIIMNYPVQDCCFSVSTIINPLILISFIVLIIVDYVGKKEKSDDEN